MESFHTWWKVSRRGRWRFMDAFLNCRWPFLPAMSNVYTRSHSWAIFDRVLQNSTTGESLEFLDWVGMARRVWCWVCYSVDTANSARNALMTVAAQTHQQLKNAKEVASSAVLWVLHRCLLRPACFHLLRYLLSTITTSIVAFQKPLQHWICYWPNPSRTALIHPRHSAFFNLHAQFDQSDPPFVHIGSLIRWRWHW